MGRGMGSERGMGRNNTKDDTIHNNQYYSTCIQNGNTDEDDATIILIDPVYNVM